jgi:hypothetical protein
MVEKPQAVGPSGLIMICPINGTNAGQSRCVRGPERAAPTNAEAIARALRSIGRAQADRPPHDRANTPGLTGDAQ